MSRFVTASVFVRPKSVEHVFVIVKIWSNSKKYASLVLHIYCRTKVILVTVVIAATLSKFWSVLFPPPRYA